MAPQIILALFQGQEEEVTYKETQVNSQNLVKVTIAAEAEELCLDVGVQAMLIASGLRIGPLYDAPMT